MGWGMATDEQRTSGMLRTRRWAWIVCLIAAVLATGGGMVLLANDLPEAGAALLGLAVVLGVAGWGYHSDWRRPPIDQDPLVTERSFRQARSRVLLRWWPTLMLLSAAPITALITFIMDPSQVIRLAWVVVFSLQIPTILVTANSVARLQSAEPILEPSAETRAEARRRKGRIGRTALAVSLGVLVAGIVLAVAGAPTGAGLIIAAIAGVILASGYLANVSRGEI